MTVSFHNVLFKTCPVYKALVFVLECRFVTLGFLHFSKDKSWFFKLNTDHYKVHSLGSSVVDDVSSSVLQMLELAHDANIAFSYPLTDILLRTHRPGVGRFDAVRGGNARALESRTFGLLQWWAGS